MNNRVFIIITLFFFLSIIIIDYLASNYNFLHRAKDGGLGFRVLSSGLICALYFYFISKQVLHFFGGFFVWLALVLLYIIVFIPLNLSFKDILIDHFLLFFIMFVIAYVLKRKGLVTKI